MSENLVGALVREIARVSEIRGLTRGQATSRVWRSGMTYIMWGGARCGTTGLSTNPKTSWSSPHF